MDFLREQQVIFTSKRFENIYFLFKEKYEVTYDELFILCASIGFRDNKKTEFKEKGREFRSNYFKRNSRATAYSIILNDPDIGKQIERFEDKNFIRDARRILEEYAEHGMEILVEKVFFKRWDGYKLEESYNEYLVDLTSFIYGQTNEVPF